MHSTDLHGAVDWLIGTLEEESRKGGAPETRDGRLAAAGVAVWQTDRELWAETDRLGLEDLRLHYDDTSQTIGVACKAKAARWLRPERSPRATSGHQEKGTPEQRLQAIHKRKAWQRDGDSPAPGLEERERVARRAMLTVVEIAAWRGKDNRRLKDLLQTVGLWRTKVRAAVDSTGRPTELLVEVRSSVQMDIRNTDKNGQTRRIRAVYGVWRERGGAGPWRLHTNPDADEALAYEKANSHNKEDERLRCDRDRWQEELGGTRRGPRVPAGRKRGAGRRGSLARARVPTADDGRPRGGADNGLESPPWPTAKRRRAPKTRNRSHGPKTGSSQPHRPYGRSKAGRS